MITKDEVTSWGQMAVAVIGAVVVVWNTLKIHTLSAKWDGFKLEYDDAIKGRSNLQGHMDEQADVRDRAEQKEKQ